MRVWSEWGIRMSPSHGFMGWLSIFWDCSRLTLQFRCPTTSQLSDYFEAFNFESAVSTF